MEYTKNRWNLSWSRDQFLCLRWEVSKHYILNVLRNLASCQVFFSEDKVMSKISIGLLGIAIIILILIFIIFKLNTENTVIREDLELIKLFLEDIDHDIHELQEDWYNLQNNVKNISSIQKIFGN